ncbi:MAG: hypothetical protein IKP96_04600 [Elusimicrobiaceae bacterium]|nr:hypothetical protein [Elusimicrobiaceae bacterium]
MLSHLRNRFTQWSASPTVRHFYARAIWVLTAVCVVCAAVLSVYMLVMRFAHLSNGLQYDELYSAVTASPKFSFIYTFKNMLLYDINLPLFNFMLWCWNRIFPFTSFWMHLFSSLFAAGAVVAAWVCAPKYWSNLKKWIFVSLMACSFVLVVYAFIVRAYSFSVLATTVFSLYALRFIHQFSEGKAPSKKDWLIFFTVGLLGAYSHYFCTAEFFITALVVFLYACYYKIGRAWAFWGTAVVFALLSGWLIYVINGLMHTDSSAWWYTIPKTKATYEIIIFLFGSQQLFAFVLYGLVVALVSFGFTYKKEFFKQADMVLPLAQIGLLLGVVALISLRYNLWMDRYFLPAMPALLLLLAQCFEHLRQRHGVLLVLWPILLVCWVKAYWGQEHLHWPEYTGLHDAFVHLIEYRKADKVLVAYERSGYPEAALIPMFEFYVPEDKKIEFIPFTEQTAPMAWSTDPKLPILMPICSQMHLIHTSLHTHTEEDGMPNLFLHDVCVYTAHPIWGRGK